MNNAAELFVKSLNSGEKFSFFTNDRKKAKALKDFMKKNGIDYEPSSCGAGIYFAINATKEEEGAVNDFLDTLFEEDAGDEEDEVP